MIPWQTRKRSIGDTSWWEYRYIENGLRCERSRKSYWDISRGDTWRSKDYSKIAKLEFVGGGTVDLRTGNETPEELEEVLSFALRCVTESLREHDLDSPIYKISGKKVKHFICRIRYYNSGHPDFGHLFSGDEPKVSISDLVDMARDAAKHRGKIRIPKEALRFDPRD